MKPKLEKPKRLSFLHKLKAKNSPPPLKTLNPKSQIKSTNLTMSSTSSITTIIFFHLILLLLLPSPSSAVLDPRDYLALQSIRASLWDLPGSTFFSTWDFTADPCSAFSGVLCSGGRVASLSLGDPRAGSPGLSGRLPSSSLSHLTALTELTLVPGRVYGPIPSTLSLCSDLRFLALSHNYLSGSIPPSLSSLRHLRTLDLSFNLLTGSVPQQRSTALTNLILCHNHLTGEIPNLSSSSSLIRLDLKRNDHSGHLPPLPHSLKYLALSSNRLSGAIDRAVSRLSNLNYLDLSMNQFSGTIPGAVFSFPATAIYLQRNSFTGGIETVGPVTARTVDLSYNRVTGVVPAGLASAERIYLNVNRFYGRVPERYGERVRRGEIKVLYLQHNFLSGMDGLVGGGGGGGGGGDGTVVPRSVSLCLNFNCMVPLAGNVCPGWAGRRKSRPAPECREWKKKEEGGDG